MDPTAAASIRDLLVTYAQTVAYFHPAAVGSPRYHLSLSLGSAIQYITTLLLPEGSKLFNVGTHSYRGREKRWWNNNIQWLRRCHAFNFRYLDENSGLECVEEEDEEREREGAPSSLTILQIITQPRRSLVGRYLWAGSTDNNNNNNQSDSSSDSSSNNVFQVSNSEGR